MDRADAILPVLRRYEPARKPTPVWTGLAAAAILCAVLLLWPRPEARLRAETLLPRIEASVSRDPSRARQGLRVRTRTATFVRPARHGVADRSDWAWREKFRASHYDWDDPVSPRAFSQWRDGVKHKADEVVVSPASSSEPKQITIQTTTQESLLQYASLTVDATSLLPVRAKFDFGEQDWVEISVIPGFLPDAEMAGTPTGAPPKSANISNTRTELPTPPPTRSLAPSELAVWLIADRLSDPMGEPIRLDIRNASRISVTPISLNTRQLQQLAANMQSIPDVDLRIPDAFQSAPQTALPDRDPAINLSETIFSRAHLLADLAQHFPEAIEIQLTPSDRVELWQLRSRHARQLEREIQSLQTHLEKLSFDIANDSVSEIATGTSLVERLAQEAGKVNRSVTTSSSGRTDGPADALITSKLAHEVARLKGLAAEYARSVTQGLEKLQ